MLSCSDEGLVSQLSKDEVVAVIAHEVGHIKHKDMIVMTVISVIPTIAYMIAISTMFSGMGRNRNSGGAVLFGIGAFAVYMITNLLILYFSRLREFYSDRFAGIITGRPSELANALAKISYGIAMEKKRESNLGWNTRQQEQGQKISERAFFISDPVNAGRDFLELAADGTKSSKQIQISHNMRDDVMQAMREEKKKKSTSMLARVSEMFMTHPHTYKRIERLCA